MAGRHYVSVNLAPAQLWPSGAGALPEQVRACCAEASVDPADVWLEVTEQAILDGGASLDVLQELRSIGVRTALDDFGIGYASLARLRDLPFDVCKLDRSFTQALAGVGGDAVVRAVNTMTRACGLQLVAEGVESDEQLRRLDRLGIDLMQGFHLHRPMPAMRLRQLLTDQAPKRTHPSAAVPRGHRRAASGDHHAVYYAHRDELVACVADALADAIATGASALIVATPEHREAFDHGLRERGIDTASARLAGCLVELDADTTLAELLTDGLPAADHLERVIADLLPDLARPLVAYGEMVALLTARGEAATAMALEETWNEVLTRRDLTLHCGYPSQPPDAGHDGRDRGAEVLEQAAQRHTHVTVARRTWSVTADEDGGGRQPGGTGPTELQRLRAALSALALSERRGRDLQRECDELRAALAGAETGVVAARSDLQAVEGGRRPHGPRGGTCCLP
ncbi:EAL domain-containing protein [Egicoccus sp. AB-alg6-2]|uniref:EAL domain-containing protein n=1 Tax=Egicoccus sp. AB-alg6-2 TaxID=3242692 RepID=UPI00359D6D55